MKIQRHTVQWRLKLWGRWTQEPRPEFTPSSSVFGTIKEMEGNAGIHGDGIRYEIIDGVSCPPDGGMARAVVRRGRAIAHDIRCRETADAVSRLPDQMRRIVRDTYVVPVREHPRSAREVARRLRLHHSSVQGALDAAHARVARSIYGPFEVL